MKYLQSSLPLLSLAAIVGGILGIIGSKYIFVNSGLSLIPWTIVGLGLGWLSTRKLIAIKTGLAYGFALTLLFMLAGYQGHNSWWAMIAFFLLISLFGALCGSVLTFISYYVKSKWQQSSRNTTPRSI